MGVMNLALPVLLQDVDHLSAGISDNLLHDCLIFLEPNLGKRAFSVAAPNVSNELPTTLKSCESLASFRKNITIYLFLNCFSISNPRRPLTLIMKQLNIRCRNNDLIEFTFLRLTLTRRDFLVGVAIMFG